MTSWLLSVAGIAILTVLVDVIVPNGHTRKYIKTVVGIVVTLVVAQPVINIVGKNNIFSVTDTTTVQPQSGYLQYVEDLQLEDMDKLRLALCESGFDSPTVTFDSEARCYRVIFVEQYTDSRFATAEAAAEKVSPRYKTQFVWNTDLE